MDETTLHILLVEDDEDYRSLLRQRLATVKDRAWSPRLHLVEAGSLAEAELALSRQPADAILLDLMLPDAAGMESVARIRAVAPDAAVVVLTSRAEERWIQQALQAGVQDYLFKSSVSQESLSRSLRYAVERKRAEVALFSQQRQAEEALHRSQHLQSLGLLAGGVAHDFNNLLTSIATQNTLALAKLSPSSSARSHLDKAARAISAAAELTRKLLTYAGEQPPALAATSLNEVVDQYVRLLAPSLPPATQVHLDLAATLPSIDADANQIQRLVMNLLVNAAEALDQGAGDVWIRTGSEPLGEDDLCRFAATAHLFPGSYVYLDVADTGAGMDEVTLRRAFEPFFTTKPEGHGLGLPTVAGIVRTHQAGIRVESAPGAGARFRVIFPVGRLCAQPEVPSQPAHGVTRSTVLVIDDEPLVLEAVADALAAAGWRTLAAERGAQGIELFRARRDEIGAVIVDVRMPHMGGVETVQRLRQIDPGVHVILCSGYVGQEDVQPHLRPGNTDFLQKPLDAERLLRLVTGSLHRPHLPQ